MNEETKIQNDIRAELSRVGLVRRNNVGTFMTVCGTPIVIGLPGEADLTLFAQGGRAVFIEVKTPTGRQSKKQKIFQERVEALGFRYVVLRSVQQARELIKELENE